jgi:hypothetical protein
VTVPRYVIERVFDPLTDAEMLRLAHRSRDVAASDFPDVAWEHSHVCADAEGTIKSYCVYSAPDEARLRAHAEAVGEHIVTKVYEVVGDLDPRNLPAL